MAWDPAVLRKYNTTGHFRLLNQVRSELKDQPIQRPLVTDRAQASQQRSEARASRGRRAAVQPQANAPASFGHEDLHTPILAVPVLTDVIID